MNKTGPCRIAAIVALFCVATAVASPAQTFTTLLSFDNTDGEVGAGGVFLESLTQGTDGNFYGTTSYGGSYIWGEVFEVTRTGKLIGTSGFSGTPEGMIPEAGVVQAANGSFYGTTVAGGANAFGSVYRLDPAGNLTTLYSFCSQKNCTDGSYPQSLLVEGRDGNFYGTTPLGGVSGTMNFCPSGCGTIFKITPQGELTTLHAFCGTNVNCPDGASPSALRQGNNGNLYGLTNGGGYGAGGTFFVITPAGRLTTLYSFESSNGGSAPNTLILTDDGNVYGTTQFGGGTTNICWGGCGTIFKITSEGVFSALYNFCTQGFPCIDGATPTGLVQGTDGNLYGTTSGGYFSYSGCYYNCGTIFKITTGGSLTTLYSFCSQTNCSDGITPNGLVQGTDGNFYGTTEIAGNTMYCGGRGCGTVYSLSMGLGPFVESNPTFGKVGRRISILGNRLTGTTSVTFNGVSASFTVVSSTLIKATVPTSATTGKIEVTTPSGTLSSNVAFQIIP